MAVAYLGLGANLGDRAANIRNALRLLGQSADVTRTSCLYETEPLGPEQPRFYNAACKIETDLTPRELLARLKEIEREVGRRPGGQPWGPREIDIDILLYDDRIVDEEGLRIPHPGARNRAFVLVPLAEIAEEARFPDGETVRELAADVGGDGVRKVADVGWEKEGSD